MRTLEELLYETAARALERQERRVAELRARTGALLAAGALSASFLGATAVERAGLSVVGVFAIGALVWTVGLCLFVLTSHDLAFTLDVPALHEALNPHVGDDRLIHLHLAYRLHRARADNQPQVDRLSARLRGASLILAAEIVLWIAALAVG